MDNTINNQSDDFWGDVVYAYTRADAINDGILVAVDEGICKEAGFTCPIAITREVWDEYVSWSEEDNRRQTYQDLEGRLWDILYMLRLAISRAASATAGKLLFSFYVIPRRVGSKARKARLTHLWAIFHPGDNYELVITIQKNQGD